MNDRVMAARHGFGLHAAHEAIGNLKNSTNVDDKIKHLTEAVEIMLAHFDHMESEKRFGEMNQLMSNY
jgi:hypothetical protein